MKPFLDRAGSIGAVVAAAACPVCFPKLALIGSLFGLGALGAYESQLVIAAQALVVVAVAGQVLAYLRHRRLWRPGLALASGAAVFAGLYWVGSEWLAYAGLFGLLVVSMADFWPRILRRRTNKMHAESVITCPACGASRKERMPVDACQFFYECRSCGAVLRPKAGDCCVFCSYGSVKCPPMQAGAT